MAITKIANRTDADATDPRTIFRNLSPLNGASATSGPSTTSTASIVTAAAPHVARFSALNVVPSTSAAQGQALSFAAASAIAIDAMKTGAASKLDNQLAALMFAQGGTARTMSAFTASVQQNVASFTADRQYVLIDTVAKDGNGAALLKQLNALGMKNGSSYGAVASGLIPVSQIAALAATTNLSMARESVMTTSVGKTTSQADPAQHTDAARAKYGVDGTGLRIGVLSDSFDTAQVTYDINLKPVTGVDPDGNRDTMATNIKSGDLPKDTRVFQDHPNGTDEGRAMAQLVHDVAPGAAIDFMTAYYGQAGFANAIHRLADAGDKIIVDDVSYGNELHFQDGVIAQAVNAVAAQGVAYFTSAGNDGTNAYGGAFVAGGTREIGGKTYTMMQFAPGQDYVTVGSSEVGGGVTLQWDSPGASAGGVGCDKDLDLFLLNEQGEIVATSTTNNLGNDPFESIAVEGYDSKGGTVSAPLFRIMVGVAKGSALPGQIKLLGSSVQFEPLVSNVEPGTLTGHHGASGALAVGAINFSKTPEYGIDPPIAELFTAGGRQTILFDEKGKRLATPQVNSIAFTAVDGTNTTFFGEDYDVLGRDHDPDNYRNFSGTSAAAPNAAATAALLLAINPKLTAADLQALLANSAIDINNAELPQLDLNGSMLAPGFDDRTGAGLIQGDKAAAFAKGGVISNDQSTRLFGTHFADTINGNALDNMIEGREGNDVIAGLGGDDTLSGGAGDDQLDGGVGNDVLNGDAGNDTLTGGAGADKLYGGIGDDILYGDDGNDALVGGDGNDRLSGYAGDDTMDGGAGDDVLNGGTGFDTITFAGASSGEIVDLYGNGINGTAVGGAGRDTLYYIENVNGTDFDDVIIGDGQANVLKGGSGADEINGGAGNDTIYGGAGGEGADYAVTTNRADIAKAAGKKIGSQATALILNTGDTGNFDRVFTPDISRSIDIPHATINAVAGGVSNDWYGFDVAAGASGVFDIDHNLLAGGGRFDTVISLVDASGKVIATNDDSDADGGSESGASYLSYDFTTAGRYYLKVEQLGSNNKVQAAIDSYAQYQLNVSLSSAGVQLTGKTAARFDYLNGGIDNDTVAYESVNSAVTVDLTKQNSVQNTGGGNSDYLTNFENVTGSRFNDLLIGDAGANVLTGGAGDDTLQGGGGADTLVGGAGRDVFRYVKASDSTVKAADIVTDFTAGQDRIDLSAIRTGVADKFAIGVKGGNTFVTVDLGGNGTTDMSIQLTGVTNVTAQDIIWTATAKG